MKKKIVLAALCFVMIFAATGCTSGTSSVSFEERKAWQLIEGSNANRETISFDAVRYSFSDTHKTEIARGNLSFALKEQKENEAGVLSTLTTQLRLVHNQQSSFNQKTDSIDSSVVFKTASLLPVSAQKTLTLASGKGYQTNTNYAEKKTVIVPIENSMPLSDSQKTYNLRSGNYFDNETLYHLIRSIPSLSKQKTYYFSIITPYDIYANNKFVSHRIKVSIGSDIVKQEVPKSIYDIAISKAEGQEDKSANDGVYSIDCLQVKVSLDAEKSGSSFYVYLSDLNFLDNPSLATFDGIYTAKVPVKIVYNEVDVNNRQTYSNEYTISSYSTLL